MPVPAQNQQYENFIIRYKQNTHGGFDYESDETFQIVNDLFGILYVPVVFWAVRAVIALMA